MEWGLLWTPLLPEIFNLSFLNSLEELVELCTVNKVFRAYFLQEERTIYLNFLLVRWDVSGLDLTRLTTRELGLLLKRGVEFFRPGGVQMGILGVLNNPSLLSLLPSDDEYPEKTEHLRYYAIRHDNDLMYRGIFQICDTRTFNVREETIDCITQNSLKCFQVVLEQIPSRINSAYKWAIQAIGSPCNHALALTLMIKCASSPTTTIESINGLLLSLGDRGLWCLFKYPPGVDKMPDYLSLVGWVLERLSRNTFWEHPMIYLIAAGASEQTLEQLVGLLYRPKDLVSLRKVFVLKEVGYIGLSGPERFQTVYARIESLWR